MKLLLVEDNAADAELLKDFFAEEQSPPEIDWVTDGSQALEYVQKTGAYQGVPTPEVIVLDLALPRVSGYDVLRQLKQKLPRCDIPVIVLSTSDNPVDRKNCLIQGAHAYFSKPYNLQGYEELVQALMGREFPKLAGGNGPAQKTH